MGRLTSARLGLVWSIINGL